MPNKGPWRRVVKCEDHQVRTWTGKYSVTAWFCYACDLECGHYINSQRRVDGTSKPPKRLRCRRCGEGQAPPGG